jgi:hypothetical protein
MTLTLDAWIALFVGTQAVVMVIALTLTVREYRNIKKENKYKAYNETVDRMYTIRQLLIQEPDLYKVFEKGPEGDALHALAEAEGFNHKYFYLVKMLLHMNESLFLRFFEQGKLRSDRNLYEPWLANLTADLSAPNVKKIWGVDVVRDSFSPDFRETVDGLIKKQHDMGASTDSADS